MLGYLVMGSVVLLCNGACCVLCYGVTERVVLLCKGAGCVNV